MTLRPPFVVTTVLSAIVVTWLGVFTLSWATHFFSVWTAEDARRIKVLADSSDLPSNPLLSHQETWRSIVSQSKPFVVLDFIYTRCPTVCNTLGFKFKQLQDQLKQRGLTNQVEVLSISFDIAHDTPQALNRYLSLHKADDSVWRALVPQSNTALEELKERFGVVVIDDEFGGFTHNAAIYVIENGELKRIFNDDSIDSAIAFIETSITSENSVSEALVQASR